MLVKFPHNCLFGICKAPSLAAPCKNSCVKIFRRIGSASSKRANFLQEKAKAQLIVCLLTSILTHYCGKFAFLNRTATGYFMPRKPPCFWFFWHQKNSVPHPNTYVSGLILTPSWKISKCRCGSSRNSTAAVFPTVPTACPALTCCFSFTKTLLPRFL